MNNALQFFRTDTKLYPAVKQYLLAPDINHYIYASPRDYNKPILTY